jgi:hypothetical protein
MSGILTWFPFNPAEAGTFDGAKVWNRLIKSVLFLFGSVTDE